MAGIHKMLVRIANREDLKKQSDLGLHYLSRPFLTDNYSSKF